MKENQLKSVVDEHIEAYLNDISHELECSPSKWFDDFGFPMFGNIEKEFHEQVYFQSFFEYCTRRAINCTLKEFMDFELFDRITWPELVDPNIYIGYTNREAEEKYTFEFINHDLRTGYRYVALPADLIDKTLSENDVDKIVVIEWDSPERCGGIYDSRQRIRYISFQDAFYELFSELNRDEVQGMYEYFISQFTKATKKAKSLISLSTLPGFTSGFLHKSRPTTLSTLQHEVRSLSHFSVKNQNYRYIQKNSQILIDCYHLPDYFITKKLENFFVGSSDFAKSFLTSEYLFRYFKRNPMFDYTPIVSGYIKSIEQLLFTICKSFISFTNKKESISHYTMGNYPAFLKSHMEMLRKEIHPAFSIIVDCLDSYRKESRNHLFHRDSFSNWERVETIRRNTIFMYVILMGMIVPELLTDNAFLCGSVNSEYDNLFYAVNERPNKVFEMLLEGHLYSELSTDYRTEGISFDKYGRIVNSIRFRYHEYMDDKFVEINQSCMPTKVWCVDYTGGRELIWQKKS